MLKAKVKALLPIVNIILSNFAAKIAKTFQLLKFA